jgi:hypothetical protein
MTTKVPKEFVLEIFLNEVFRKFTTHDVLDYIIKSFHNHDAAIVSNPDYDAKIKHLTSLLDDHKDDIEYVHNYLSAQNKALTVRTKKDPNEFRLHIYSRDFTKKLNVTYQKFVPTKASLTRRRKQETTEPYEEPEVTKSEPLQADVSQADVSQTYTSQTDTSQTVFVHRLHPKTLILLKTYQQTFGNIHTIALLGCIPCVDSDSFEDLTVMQILKYILVKNRSSYEMIRRLLYSSLNAVELTVFEDDYKHICS